MFSFITVDNLIVLAGAVLVGWAANSWYVQYKSKEAARLLTEIQAKIARRKALVSQPTDPDVIAAQAREKALVDLIKDEASELK